MPRIGETLVKAGLVTRDMLEKAQMIQEHRGGRLGPILASIGAASQEDIDRTWIAANITPKLEDAIDRACGNRFTNTPNRSIRYERIHRHETMTEDMLCGSELIGATVTMDGRAIMILEGRESLPIEFRIDLDNGFALLDDNSEAIARRWVAMVDRQRKEASAADAGESVAKTS